MRAQLRHRRQRKCPHRATVSVVSSGVHRMVCETCGHVSVHFTTDLDGEVERDRFARPVERGASVQLPELALVEDLEGEDA